MLRKLKTKLRKLMQRKDSEKESTKLSDLPGYINIYLTQPNEEELERE